MLKIILLASGAGIIGTGLGGIIGLIFGKSSKKAVSFLLSFAAGVMLGVVCFDLIPESLKIANILLVITFILLGGVAVRLLNAIIDKLTRVQEKSTNSAYAISSKSSMFRSGLIMFFAISLHNLPEGMAIGSSSTYSYKMGLSMAVLIALHDIPEGMSIGIPLIEGGMNKWKSVGLTLLSGIPTLIGGWIGAVIGSAGEIFVACSLSVAAGTMLYVTYFEIMPQVVFLNRGRRPSLFTIIGVLFALIMVNILM